MNIKILHRIQAGYDENRWYIRSIVTYLVIRLREDAVILY